MLFEKINKKTIAIILLITLITCLSACHRAEKSNSNTSSTIGEQEMTVESTADVNKNIENETEENEEGLIGLITSFLPRGRQTNQKSSDEEESELIKEKSEEIIRCLTKGDKEAFRLLFCDQVRQSETFDQEVDAVFDYFPCGGYIDSQILEYAGGSKSIAYGIRTEWSVSPIIKYIEVMPKSNSAGVLSHSYYGVHYSWHIKNLAHSELEGLDYFEIKLLNTDDLVKVGSEY